MRPGVSARIGGLFLRWSIAGAITLVAASRAVAACGDAPGDFDAVAATRASVASQCDCAAAVTHGEYVRCAREVVNAALAGGSLPKQCASTAMRCARRSTCGRKPGYVPCCRTNRNGVTKCSIKSSAGRCRAPSGGSACASTFAKSCCDACMQGGCILPTPTPTATPRPTPTPPGFCQSLIGLPALAQVPVSLLPGSADCGGEHFSPPGQPPFTGRVDDVGGNKLADLGLGCLYTGMLPPTKLPSGSNSVLDVVGIGLPTVTLAGSVGTGPTDCTKGAGPLKHCLNGAPGSDGQGLCTTDAECNGKLGACLPDANCYFGPPVPVAGEFPACSVNALLTDMCGSLNVLTFEVNFAVAISARTYLTLDAESPCPQCIGGLCTAGERAGEACTPLGSYNTSLDCPPLDSQYLAALQVVIPSLTTGTSALTADANGSFCDEQGAPGALGFPQAHTVTQTGAGVASGGLSGETTAVGTFCIYPTGNPIIDISGGFPNVGTLSAKTAIDVADVLLP